MTKQKLFYGVDRRTTKKSKKGSEIVHIFASEDQRDEWVSKKKRAVASPTTGFIHIRRAVDEKEAQAIELDNRERNVNISSSVKHFVDDGLRKAHAESVPPSRVVGGPLLERWPFLVKNVDIPRNSDVDFATLTSSAPSRIYWRCDVCDKVFPRTVKEIAGQLIHLGEEPGHVVCPKCAREERMRTASGVVCVETGAVYPSIADAARDLAHNQDLTPKTIAKHIGMSIKNGKTTLGYHWVRGNRDE